MPTLPTQSQKADSILLSSDKGKQGVDEDIYILGGKWEDEEERRKACEFWSSVRNYANSLYWAALDNDANTDYPITKMICKGAILDHHIMRKCNSKI